MSDIERWISEAVARGEMSDPFLRPSGQELAERGIGREDWEEDQANARSHFPSGSEVK